MNIILQYEESFRKHSKLPALTDYLTGKTWSYRELAARVDFIHAILTKNGIGKGDKVALVGKNSIDWISVYIGVITYGATIVPILPDFNPVDMEGIINHSDARLLFADSRILEHLNVSGLDNVAVTLAIETLPEPDCKEFDIEKLHYASLDDEDTLIISYTSGTTGNSKGVMLPVRSITANVQFAIDHKFHFKGSRVLALLPLAHAYGCAFDMLTPLATGSHIYVLGKIPTPSILIKALGEVKPHLICTVPLVMEKIVQKNVLPLLEKQPLKTLVKIPLVKNCVFAVIRKKMLSTFGDRVKEVNMGGAALATDVENFLYRIRFPFTIGYGMTECGPLISYQRWKKFKKTSCGRLLPGMSVALDTDGFDNGLGEICVKGTNVMTGYYKNPEATEQALRGGWLHTGDVGFVDKSGTIFLRGRCKSMILTSAGQNIYPEEIEGKLNHLEGVAESLVYEKDGKLIALVVPDADMMKNQDTEGVLAYMKGLLAKLNSLVAPFEKIAEIKTCAEPFEKTPKQSIKRFLYPKMAKLLGEKKDNE